MQVRNENVLRGRRRFATIFINLPVKAAAGAAAPDSVGAAGRVWRAARRVRMPPRTESPLARHSGGKPCRRPGRLRVGFGIDPKRLTGQLACCQSDTGTNGPGHEGLFPLFVCARWHGAEAAIRPPACRDDPFDPGNGIAPSGRDQKRRPAFPPPLRDAATRTGATRTDRG